MCTQLSIIRDNVALIGHGKAKWQLNHKNSTQGQIEIRGGGGVRQWKD